MVHLSPISCSAPAIGQPSILRRRKSRKPRIYPAAQKYAHLSISANPGFLFGDTDRQEKGFKFPKYNNPKGGTSGCYLVSLQELLLV
jgi:hypothetical protein